MPCTLPRQGVCGNIFSLILASPPEPEGGPRLDPTNLNPSSGFRPAPVEGLWLKPVQMPLYDYLSEYKRETRMNEGRGKKKTKCEVSAWMGLYEMKRYLRQPGKLSSYQTMYFPLPNTVSLMVVWCWSWKGLSEWMAEKQEAGAFHTGVFVSQTQLPMNVPGH